MDTVWFLSKVHEFRSIIWFGVFLCFVALCLAGLWYFAERDAKKGDK